MNKKQIILSTLVCILLTCLLLIRPYTTEAATKVALNQSTVYLVKGETTSLKVTGTSKKATWSSNNKKVATVNTSGKITAVAYGTTYIKATVNKTTYKCKVIVVNPTKINLSPSTKKVTVNGKAVSVNPNSSTYSNAAIKAMKLTYKVSGNTGAKVSNTGMVTATKAGTFTVTAYVHGKKIKTITMQAVAKFTGFTTTEVEIPVDMYKEVYFADKYLLRADDIVVKSSDPSVAIGEGAYSYQDLDHYYGIVIEGLKDGTATLSVTIDGITKSIKVIVGQGVNILTPVEAVKQNNFTGYSGNSLTTLKWVRNFIDTNNLDSDSLTDREKLTIIQTYLNSTFKTNTGQTNYRGGIARILFNGYIRNGDCFDYTKTICFLCECIDIEVYECDGSSDNGNGLGYFGHSWNKVKVDGKWYYLDAYWNAGLNTFDYFLSNTVWSSHKLYKEGKYTDMNYDDNPYANDID